jgi:hypothetical protein
MTLNCGYQQSSTSRIIQGLFYYFLTSVLILLLGFIIYQQMESDSAEIKMVQTEVTLNKGNRSFYVPFEVCNTKPNDFILLRRYKNIQQGVYFNAPDGIYRSNFTGCATTYLQAYAGNLEPGVYDYTVFVRYDVNFLRSIEKQAAHIRVNVK